MRHKSLLIASAACLSLIVVPRVGAVSTQVRTIEGDVPASNFAFGMIPSTGTSGLAPRYLTSAHYIQIERPTPRRTIYFYSDNGTFGTPGEGLVSWDGSLPPLPLYWRGLSSKGSDVQFRPDQEVLWTPLPDRSSANFTVQKDALSRVPMGTSNAAVLYLGMKLPPGTRAGEYRARLVVEEFSDSDDIAAPSLTRGLFTQVILLPVPLILPVAWEDSSRVVGSTVYYRMEGDSDFQSAPVALTADTTNPFRWTGQASIPRNRLRPGRLEYYFVSIDEIENSTATARAFATLAPDDVAVSGALPAEGGTVSVAVGDLIHRGVELTVPAKALANPVSFGVTRRPGGAFAPLQGVSAVEAYDISPDGLRFARPATLALPYRDDDGDGLVDGTNVEAATLRIFWFDGFSWRYVGGTVDAEARQVRVNVSHLSVYGLFPFAQALTPELVRQGLEKLITPNGDGNNDFATFNISGDFEVKFFDVRGALVRTLSSVNVWDGRDDAGKPVENGTYVYRLTGQGLTVTGMIAVAR
jgi:hypothetical protein